MRQNAYIVLGIFVLAAFSCHRKVDERAVTQYVDEVVAIRNSSVTQIDSFFQSVYYTGYHANNFYDKATGINQENLRKLEALGSFKKNDNLLNAANSTCLTIDEVLSHEGEELLTLINPTENEGNLWRRQEIDTLLRSSIRKISVDLQRFDSVLTLFLNDYKMSVMMDTTQISSSVKFR